MDDHRRRAGHHQAGHLYVRVVAHDMAGARGGTPDPGLVSRLLQEQRPELAGRPVRPSHAFGSSNWVFRVGDGHAVRLPRSDAYAVDLLTEAQWLPRLSPLLDTPVPDVEFLAEPSALFPRPWTLVTWLSGVESSRVVYEQPVTVSLRM